MTPKSLQSQIALGEDSKRQFKVDVRNAESLAAEMAAFANSQGRQMFLGVADDGSTPGLAAADVSRINQLITVHRKPVAELDLVGAHAPGNGPGKPIAPKNAPKSGENALGISNLKGQPSYLSGQNDPINDLLIGIIREAPNADYGTLAQVLHVSEATVKSVWDQ